MLNESNFQDLLNNIVKFFPTTKRQYATGPIQIDNIKIIPFIGMKTLFVSSDSINENKQYKTIMVFKKVNYKENGIKVKSYDGNYFYLEQIVNNEVLLRCNCNDFFYRFHHWNHIDESLFGKDRKKYIKKGNGVSVNPLKLPGICKHIIKLNDVLSNYGILKIQNS